MIVQSIAGFMVGLAIVLALSTWKTSGVHHRGTVAWLWGYLLIAVSIGLVVLRHRIDDHGVLFAVSNVFLTLGGWFHYHGVSEVLRRRDHRVRRAVLVGTLGITVASGLAQVMGDVFVVALVTADVCNLTFLGLVTWNLLVARDQLRRGIRWPLATGPALLGFLYLTSALGGLGQALGLPVPPDMTNPGRIWTPLGWIVVVIVVTLCEHLLVAALLAREFAGLVTDSEANQLQLHRLNGELTQFQSQIVRTLADLLESRTDDAASHVRQVAEHTKMILVRLGFSQEYATFVADASTLHDIGKIALPDHILKKDGFLTTEEREAMQGHTDAGSRLLGSSDIPFFQLAALIAADHHEHWDGTGYPRGKRGTEIALEARAVAVADAYDALTTSRSYKEPWSDERATAYLIHNAGKRFDPEIVSVFLVGKGS